MSRYRIIVSTLLAVCLTAPALAHGQDLYNQVELRQHMLKLTLWLETHSDMNTQNIPLPNIEILHEDELCKMAFSDKVATNSQICSQLEGLYNYMDKVVYIDEDVNLNSIEGKLVLLHELVHYYQFEYHYVDDKIHSYDIEVLPRQFEQQYLLECIMHGKQTEDSSPLYDIC